MRRQLFAIAQHSYIMFSPPPADFRYMLLHAEMSYIASWHLPPLLSPYAILRIDAFRQAMPLLTLRHMPHTPPSSMAEITY